MPGRRRPCAARRPVLWRLAVATGLAVAAMTAFAAQPAGAAPATVSAQLSLSGITTQSSPAGGSVVGVHPGDAVTFSAATVPAAGLDALGLGGLTGALNGLLCYQVTADFSGLPGGTSGTRLNNCGGTLAATRSKTFSFPKAGTYAFTWSAQQVNVLGGVVPIVLDGNRLAAAGITLDASNRYVGQVVVADDPPAGGISVQIPGVSVAPRLPAVGQLPSAGLPGIAAPTAPTAGLPGTPGGSGITYTPPAMTVPEMVVPQGDGPVVGPDLNSTASLAVSLFGSPRPGAGTHGSRAPAFPLSRPVQVR